MAGAVGGGGLGDIAVRYGYQRFETQLMWITVAILAVVISVIQFAGDYAARALHRRGGRSGPHRSCGCLKPDLPPRTPRPSETPRLVPVAPVRRVAAPRRKGTFRA